MISDLIYFPEHDPGGKVRITVPPEISSEAIYSPCKQYRYLLHRRWAPEQPKQSIMFVMLNPSTATEDYDDPTVRKCRQYALRWGYNHLIIGNIMAYRATEPCLLRGLADPVGPDNLTHLRQALESRPMTICAWGSVNVRFKYAERGVVDLIRDIGIEPYALQLNVTGGPYHPLYLPLGLTPVAWRTG